MKITTVFKDGSDAPQLGLTPKISITDITNILSPSLVVNAANMTGISFGFYGYEFTTYVKEHKYSIYIDADSAIDYRYQYGTIGEDVEITREAVWDEVLTGATHNIPTSAGRRLRAITAPIILEGFVMSATDNTVSFDGEASTANGAYDPCVISIVAGPGAGQSRLILEYNGLTKTATVDRNWKINPTELSEYIIVSDPGREHVNEGGAQGGTTNSITLNANASSFDDAYRGQVVFIRSGQGQDQARRIKDYNGTTKVAIVEKDWNEIPDNTTGYVLLPTAVMDMSSIAAAVWEALLSNYTGDGTAGQTLSDINTNVDEINIETDAESIASAVWDKGTEDHLIPGTFGSSITEISDDTNRIRNIEEGNWKIIGTQMVFYDINNIEMFRFDLRNKDGRLSDHDVFSRLRV